MAKGLFRGPKARKRVTFFATLFGRVKLQVGANLRVKNLQAWWNSVQFWSAWQHFVDAFPP